MKEFERKEFGFVNLVVEVNSKSGIVKVWACSKDGQNQFRLKAMGKVHAADINDVIVAPEKGN